MLIASRVLIIIAGVSLIADAILIYANIPNPFFGYPLPCPNTLLLLGVGILLFAIGSKAFKRD